MAKIIQFPVKFMPPLVVNSTGKSDIQELIDKLIIVTKSHGRTQGFLVGIFLGNIQYIIMQYFLR